MTRHERRTGPTDTLRDQCRRDEFHRKTAHGASSQFVRRHARNTLKPARSPSGSRYSRGSTLSFVKNMPIIPSEISSLVSFSASPFILRLNGRVLCILGAEYHPDHKLLSEVILLFPHDKKPRAIRFSSDFRAVSDMANSMPGLKEEINRLVTVAQSLFFEYATENDRDLYDILKVQTEPILGNIEGSDLNYILIAERKNYAFSWILEHTECTVIRKQVSSLLSLPQIDRAETKF